MSKNFFFPVLQPKLTINQPNDIYEREADAVAEKVMRMPDKRADSLFFQPRPLSISPIQRKCAGCEEEELQRKEDEEEEALQLKPIHDAGISRKCSQCEEEENVQMKGEDNMQGGMTAPSIVNDVINSNGQPLDRDTRNFMESRFGYDFGNVQIHDNSLAHRSSKDINALAYTNSSHIVFGAGQYQPNTPSGKKLLAHELAHVVQQKNDSVMRAPKHLQVLPEGATVPGTIIPWSAALRSRPSHEGKVIADLVRGQKVQVLGGHAWLKVQAIIKNEVVEGYVSYELIRLDDTKPTEMLPPKQCFHHYRVELKVWIPFKEVVDPESMGIGTWQHSTYEGDDHKGYDGSYRVLIWAEFDWDGYKISNFGPGKGDYGTTVRWALLLGQTGKATCCTEAKLINDQAISLLIDSKNPLVWLQSTTPSIDSHLIFGFERRGGQIFASLDHDNFPSHGFRILRDGKEFQKEVGWDASIYDPNSRIQLALALTDGGVRNFYYTDDLPICAEGLRFIERGPAYPDTVGP